MKDDSEDAMDADQRQVDDWYDQFSRSAEFSNLTQQQKREAGSIIEFFAEYSKGYLDASPKSWTVGVVRETCTDFLPRKVSAGIEFFEAVAPVLSAFFTFLARVSLLKNGRSLAETVTRIHSEIMRNSQDPSNWGPAKGFIMMAMEAGVDVTDEKALTDFTVQYSARIAARRTMSEDGQAPPLEDPLKGKPPPSDRYAPCPCGSGKKYKFCCEPRR